MIDCMRILLQAGSAALMVLSTPLHAQSDAEIVAYENGFWFDGEGFTQERRVTANGVFVAVRMEADRTVDLNGAYVVPPLGDAHTHQFDGPWAFKPQNDAQLRSGAFYAMTMTAPTSGVAQIRYRFDDTDTVDVATSLGGLTGPSSHPAEVYEAIALRIFDPKEQADRLDEIRASQRAKGDAYWIVEDETSAKKALDELIRAHPDIIKIYLRHSAEYGRQTPDNWAIGGIDPELLPTIAARARQLGIRLAVATSDMSDVRAAIEIGADIITHLPCYQDTSEPGPYFYAATDENCLLSEEDARAIASLDIAVTIITSELAKDQAAHVRARFEANVRKLHGLGAKLIIGSNSYSETVRAGLVAESQRKLLTPAELLRMASIDTPQTIFPDRKLGCFDLGCEASFLALGANPLDDMTALQNFRLMVKRGSAIELEGQD